MNRLNIPQSGGFPINNENLRVLSNYAEQFNKIFNALRLPARSCVFLDVPSLIHTNQQVSCYVKGNSFNGNIVILSTSSYSISQLIQSNNLTVNSNIDYFNTVVAGTTYANVRSSETATLSTTVTNPWQFMFLEEALKMQVQKPSDSVDLADCNFLGGTDIAFDVNDQITGATPLNSEYTFFVGTGNSIERIGNFLRINFTFTSAAGGLGTNVKNIIEIPADFVNFSKIVKLSTVITSDNIVNSAFLYNYDSFIYKNYIILPSTAGSHLCVVDFIPIV